MEIVQYLLKIQTQKTLLQAIPSTIRKTNIVLHEALEQAVRNQLIIRNVTTLVTLPRKSQKEIKILTLDEQKKLIGAVRGERLEAAYLLALASGVRLGELLGLRWQDIDFKEGIMKVRQAISRTRVFDDKDCIGTELVFQEPKTKSGKRNIPLPESIIAELKSHKNRQTKERWDAKESYENNDLVFCTEFGKPVDPRNLVRRYYQLINEAKIPKTNFHALRHTFAMRLLELNEHPKVVQEMLGHASISITLDTYSHVMPELKKAAASKLNSLFERENPPVKEGLS